MLVIEVDEMGAVDIIVGASGRIGYPVSPLEQLRSRCKGSSNLLVTILVPASLSTGNKERNSYKKMMFQYVS